MALQKKGSISNYYANGVAIQPGYSIVEKNDGTLEGNVTYECDAAAIASLPAMGSMHPRDGRCEAYNIEKTWIGLNKIQATVSYFGIISKQTRKIVSYTPNTNMEPIETNPLFSTFAGTKASPLNGAKFDAETGEFLGFFNQSIKDLFGVTHYLVPATMVSLSYWQTSVPRLSRRMSIVNSIPGFNKPGDVKDFLLLDMPYRQVGSHYQVTEQYMGSGPNGFSTKIYQ